MCVWWLGGDKCSVERKWDSLEKSHGFSPLGASDAFLVVVIDGSGSIHPDGPEVIDALERRGLDEAIALSLATSAASVPQMRSESPIPMARPPPAPTNRVNPRTAPVINRAPAAVLNRVPVEPTPLPPDQSPTLRHRVESRRRIASLPTLFPPTGAACGNSALAKAPPIRGDSHLRFRVLQPGPERLAYFPRISVALLLVTCRHRVPPRRFSKVKTRRPRATTAVSTAPSREWGGRD